MPRTRKAGKRYWKCIKSYWKQVLFLFKKKKNHLPNKQRWSTLHVSTAKPEAKSIH